MVQTVSPDTGYEGVTSSETVESHLKLVDRAVFERTLRNYVETFQMPESDLPLEQRHLLFTPDGLDRSRILLFQSYPEDWSRAIVAEQSFAGAMPLGWTSRRFTWIKDPYSAYHLGPNKRPSETLLAISFSCSQVAQLIHDSVLTEFPNSRSAQFKVQLDPFHYEDFGLKAPARKYRLRLLQFGLPSSYLLALSTAGELRFYDARNLTGNSPEMFSALEVYVVGEEGLEPS